MDDEPDTRGVDPLIIGSSWLDDPKLRDLLRFDPGLAKDAALVRGIAIHLLDRLDAEVAKRQETEEAWADVKDELVAEGDRVTAAEAEVQRLRAMVTVMEPLRLAHDVAAAALGREGEPGPHDWGHNWDSERDQDNRLDAPPDTQEDENGSG
jgi:hypothetical protein